MARRAHAVVVLEAGATVVVGDDDWGVAPAEVVQIDHATGSMVLRLAADVVDKRSLPSVAEGSDSFASGRLRRSARRYVRVRPWTMFAISAVRALVR